MRYFLKLCLMATLILFSFQFSHAMGQSFFFTENSLVGEKAPVFKLNLLSSGKEVSLTDYRNNQPAIIFYWATWCPHCREELKYLNENSAQFETKGIKIILVDLGDNANQVKAYVKKNGIKFDTFLDEQSSSADDYGIVGVPTFFFLDKDGTIQQVEHSLPDDYEKVLKLKT